MQTGSTRSADRRSALRTTWWRNLAPGRAADAQSLRVGAIRAEAAGSFSVCAALLVFSASACSQLALNLDDWPCQTADDCVSGYACNLATGICEEAGSLCVDYDGDKLGNGIGGNPGCAHEANDVDDQDPSVCGDTDLDGCEDCASLTFDPSADGLDTDGDGLCDIGDTDDDGDGVVDDEDAHPTDPTRCRDVDADGCDDCTRGRDNTYDDGTDTDGDGICNLGDDDDDGDTVLDEDDIDPLDIRVCQDSDNDGCDDCAEMGRPEPDDDGLDTDKDGTCDFGDDDDDGDSIADINDVAPLNRYACRDDDDDGCDDCSQTGGPPNRDDDGLDTDGDGLCNAGDPDDDGDNVVDSADEAPLDNHACRDQDGDTCDDCSSGTDAPGNDGIDTDSDGLCDAGDTCTDEDRDQVGNGSHGNSGCAITATDSDDSNSSLCADQDSDGCDDCAVTGGPPQPGNDGLDTDGDGTCNAGDSDDDNDGVLDAEDNYPTDRMQCRDVDADGCDDCSSGSDDESNDGIDTDGDGACNAGDDDDDGDTVPDADDLDPLVRTVCRDSDNDDCDDCAVTRGPPDAANDGDDLDEDGLCDTGDPDIDGDGVANAGDSNDFNPYVCRDSDKDTCDDCTGGSADPANDGADLDGDGLCDAGDPDIDGDSVDNGADDNPRDPNDCLDQDGDTCDDCSVTGGPPDTSNDGSDLDNDGTCDATDTCTDEDGDGLGNGTLSNTSCANPTTDLDDTNTNKCADTDNDTCDDCANGDFDPNDDGLDLDSDGLCNAGDSDIDGDSVANADDPNDYNDSICGDSDSDTCDDCSVTQGPPDTSNDGSDRDSDGTCDAFDWFDADWRWRIPISVNQALVMGTLSNFPVLVSIQTDGSLAYYANTDGTDLVFTQGDGKTRISAEVEEWSKANGNLLAWVCMPTISNTGGTSPELYLYYGYTGSASLPTPPAEAGTWDSDFRGVWHLDDDPTSSLPTAIKDSTIYGNHGAAVGDAGTWTADDLVASVVGNGTRFDDTSTYLNMGSAWSIDDLNPLTFEVWLYPYSWGGSYYGRIVSKATDGGTLPWSFFLYGVSSELITYRDRETTDLRVRTDGNAVTQSAWQHLALVVDTDTDELHIYVNGAEAGYLASDTEYGAGARVSDSTYNLLLGNNGLQDRALDGVLDEARLSSTARSAAWIRTSYNTQANPSLFLSYGSDQQRPSN